MNNPLLLKEIQTLFPRETSQDFIETFLGLYGRDSQLAWGKPVTDESFPLRRLLGPSQLRHYSGKELAYRVAHRYNSFELLGIFIELIERAQNRFIAKELIRACIKNLVYQTLFFVRSESSDGLIRPQLIDDQLSGAARDRFLQAVFNPHFIIKNMRNKPRLKHNRYFQRVRHSRDPRRLPEFDPEQFIEACSSVNLPGLADFIRNTYQGESVYDALPWIAENVGKILKVTGNRELKRFKKKLSEAQ